MLSRKIGSLLRGQATPYQIITACTLGAMLGFAPALHQAPGLYVLLLIALAVTNANVGLALLVTATTKVLSLIVAPTSYALGELLLDGPTAGIADALVHAPVIAWCGLSYYAVAGGQLLGLGVGLFIGLVATRVVGAFRRRMAAAEDNDSKLGAVMGKRPVRFLMWLFFGKKGKKTWAEKADVQRARPIRFAGVAFVVATVAGLWYGQQALTSDFAREALAHKLETVNGATVELGSFTFDLGAGEFGVANLALADREDLGRDLFRAEEISADIDQVDMLRRRVHIARIVVAGASTGAKREVPGVLFERAEPQEKDGTTTGDAPRDGVPAAEETGTWSLDEVLEDAETWKVRLAQADRWLTRLSKGEDDDCKVMPCGGKEPAATRAERVQRESGWFAVESERLSRPAPSFRISDLAVEGLAANWLPGAVFDLRATELSTAPWLVDAPPTITLTSHDGTVGFATNLAPASRGGGLGALKIYWKGLDVDQAMSMLRLDGAAPLTGGTLDLELNGAWADGEIGALDVPVRVTFRGSTLVLPEMEDTVLDELVVPLHLSGTLLAPEIHFDGQAFTDQLLEIARTELESRARAELESKVEEALGEELDGALEELQESTGVEVPEVPEEIEKTVEEKAGGLLRGALGSLRKKKD